MPSTPLDAAIAGFVRGLGSDWWPAEVHTGAFDTNLLEQAEVLAHGGSVRHATGTAGLSHVFAGYRSDPDSASFYSPPRSASSTFDAIFPTPTVQRTNFDLLKVAFQNDLKSAHAALEGEPFFDAALDAGRRHLCSVPAPFDAAPYLISLFHHAKSVAAISACLSMDNSGFCLLGCDQAGVFPFIFNLSTERAAASMRARSFYLRFLSDLLGLHVTRSLNLPLCNLLRLGAGRFAVIAPQSVIPVIEQLRVEIATWLLETHGGQIAMPLDYISVSHADLSNFGSLHNQVFDRVERELKRPFARVPAHVLETHLSKPVATPFGFCKVTGEPLASADDEVTPFVASFEELGRILPRMKRILISAQPATSSVDAPRTWESAIRTLGYEVQIDYAHSDLNLASEPIWIWELASTNQQTTLSTGAPASKFYPVPQITPVQGTTKDGKAIISTFDELCAGSRGIKRWAALHLDTDGLGAVFRHTDGHHRFMGGLETLVHDVRQFFDLWLPQLTKANAGYPNDRKPALPKGARTDATFATTWALDDLSDKLYLQYVGGEEIFLVGAWDAVVEFALRVRGAFDDYTLRRHTLCAGITLHGERFPVYWAVREAGDALQRAKRRDKKNAVSFMDMTLAWPTFADAWQLARLFERACSEGILPMSVLRNITQLEIQRGVEMKQSAASGKAMPSRASWLAHYYLTRATAVIPNTGSPLAMEARKELEQIQKAYATQGVSTAGYHLAARMAGYLLMSEAS